MPQSSRERQEALRAKREMLGMAEVRGIYLPPELHAELKRLAKELAERANEKSPSSPRTDQRGGMLLLKQG